MGITVLLTTYNAERFLSDTLQSVSRQVRKPDEVLIVDDHSKDSTLALVQHWANEQPYPVRILQNQLAHDLWAGPGPAAGRMTGLLEVGSELVALLDHDDLMLPHHLRLTEQAFGRHPDLELCFGDATEFTEGAASERNFSNGTRLHEVAFRQGEEEGLRIVTEPIFETMLTGSYIPTAANLWRSSTAKKIGGFMPHAGTCDDSLFFMCLSRMGTVAYYPYPIARKRDYPGNLTTSPANALRINWNSYDAIAILLEDAERWHLTSEEVSLANARLDQLQSHILYHSSKSGWKTYNKSRQRLGSRGKLRIGDLIRSVLSSGK